MLWLLAFRFSVVEIVTWTPQGFRGLTVVATHAALTRDCGEYARHNIIRKTLLAWHRITIVLRKAADFIARRNQRDEYSKLLSAFASWILVVESKRRKVRQTEQALRHYDVTLAVKAIHSLVANVDALAAASSIARVRGRNCV